MHSAAFLQELCEKETRYFKVYDTYTPNLKKALLTNKFYSKYEAPRGEKADVALMEAIKKVKYDTPRERYGRPLTENQSYGWYIEPIVPLDRDDQRFYHPRRCADFIKHYLKLQMEESTLPKVKFTGVPFKVQ